MGGRFGEVLLPLGTSLTTVSLALPGVVVDKVARVRLYQARATHGNAIKTETNSDFHVFSEFRDQHETVNS